MSIRATAWASQPRPQLSPPARHALLRIALRAGGDGDRWWSQGNPEVLARETGHDIATCAAAVEELLDHHLLTLEGPGGQLPTEHSFRLEIHR